LPGEYASVVIGIAGEGRSTVIRLVTDAFMVRGTIFTRHRRITDMLNSAEHEFLVLTETTFVEFGVTGRAMQSDFAQVNLNAVLFGVADEPVEPTPELRVPKVSERAFISVPPFTVTGEIHLLPGADLRQALEDLVGRFLPVTNATYWSDRVGEAPTPALVVAVNHNRAQILAPHRDSDPWADLDRSGGAGAEPAVPEPASPWGDLPEPVVPQTSSPLQRRLSQRSTGKSSLLPHSAQPPS
jgi:hypothetical protein